MKTNILLDGYNGLRARCLDDVERRSLPHWVIGVVSEILNPEQARHVLEVVESCLLGDRMRRTIERREENRQRNGDPL